MKKGSLRAAFFYLDVPLREIAVAGDMVEGDAVLLRPSQRGIMRQSVI
jgi:hypothetical protein